GSCFTVTVYLKRQNTITPDMAPFKDQRVLVVDQDINSCKSSCSVLTEIGIKSVWITDGTAVIKRIREAENAQENFFAIIIDQKIRSVDGIQLANKIKKEFGKKAPAIILSVQDWGNKKTDTDCEEIDGLISKPLFKSRLLYILKNIMEKESKKTPDKTETSPEQLFKGKRILLVDDIEINREIAVEIIGTTGINVETANNGKEALDKFEEMEAGYYQLIFMDIQMPVMNGYEATKAIRKSKKADAKQIPIVAMTANAFTEDMIASKRAGMNEHIAKPLNVEQLLDCLKRWLSDN
ncbi:MAG TPA: hybrid sensor histidine kinase/response regulator, partial [Lachnospiraceae bacterium]|nr:hybrid sensor histidine kinase/response regulator [Lachnospiraceae bacterium]